MKKKILAALVMFAVLAAVSAYADTPYTTKLTLVIPLVNEDLVSADGTYSGTAGTPATRTDQEGRSITKTETVFNDRLGQLIMSADVSVTAESADIEGIAGYDFAQALSIDVTLDLEQGKYSVYTYSLDVSGLPEWVSISGELVSTDAVTTGTAHYHHSITLSGRPEVSADSVSAVFTAVVKVSGDVPILLAKGSKNVNISVKSVLVSLDVSVSGDRSISQDLGGNSSAVLEAEVRGKYSDGNILTLSSGEYVIEWTTASNDVTGITLNGSTVAVDSSAAIGTYRFPVAVTVSSGDLSSSANAVVVIEVMNIAPVITASASGITARKGEYTSGITITASKGENISWSYTGSLPAGLTFTSADKTATISGTPANGTTGAYPITITAENNRASASVDVNITVTGNTNITDSIDIGTPGELSVNTDAQGRSISSRTTTYRNAGGNVIMSADVAIIAESADMKGTAGEAFTAAISVDVVIQLDDNDYSKYLYSMDIAGLPDWLSVDGETVSTDTISTGTTEYHHEFALSGTPEKSADVGIVFTAWVKVSGDIPVLAANVSKDIAIHIDEAEQKSEQETTDNNGSYLETRTEDNGTETQSLSDIVSNMTPEQVEAVTTLKINTDISDLAGIEAFTNLQQLDLTEAVSLETVDLSGNTSIKSVDVSGNNAVKTLTLTGSNVETLDASGCESLEEVNVSGCDSLVSLDVSNTPITDLNAEDCKNLQYLDCSSCSINDLRLEGCDSLNILDCSNNRLPKLDAGTFKALNTLSCFNQNITGWIFGRTFSFVRQFMHVSAADDEEQTYGAENVTNLRAWDDSGNEITDIDYDPETGIAVFGSTPSKITYDYLTGFQGVNMDVTVSGSPEEEDSTREATGPGASGGCNTGMAISWIIFAFVFGFMLIEKRT